MITPRHTPEGALARVRQETCTGAFPAAAIVVAKPDDSPGAISREKGEDGAATRWSTGAQAQRGTDRRTRGSAGSLRSDFEGEEVSPKTGKGSAVLLQEPQAAKI